MKNIEKNISEERQDEIMEKVHRFYEIATDGNADLYDRMEKANKYTYGEQWDAALKAYNQERGKYCLTIPLVRPQIKQLVGQVVQNPKDITILNHKGGMKVLADLQTALVMHALKDETVKFELIQMFDEGNSTGASYIGVFINHDRDPYYGDLEIRKLDCFDVLPDPTSKTYDLNSRHDGAKFLIWDPYVDKDWVAKRWPAKADHLDSYFAPTRQSLVRRAVSRMVRYLTGSTLTGRDRITGAYEGPEVFEFRHRLNHTWWIEFKPIYYFYDLRDENADPLVVVDPSEKKEAQEAVKAYKDVFALEETIGPVMNHTLTIGEVFLENRYDELNLIKSGETMFPVIPFYPYLNNGYKSCPAEDMIGAQDFVNWTRSMVANILKDQGTNRWFIKNDMMNKKSWLESHGSESNIVIDKSWFGGEVEKIKPEPVPPAAQLTELGKGEIREITNIRRAEPERDVKAQSGIAIAQKQEEATTGISPILSNYDYTLHLLGNCVATVIRSTEVYRLSEITKIVDDKNLLDSQLLSEARLVAAKMMGVTIPPPVQFSMSLLTVMDPLDAEQMRQRLKSLDRQREAVLAKLDVIAKPIAIQGLVDAMRNLRAGRYNTTVTTSPAAPTFRMKQFAETMQINEALLAGGSPPLPPKHLLEASDLANKEAIMADMGL